MGAVQEELEHICKDIEAAFVFAYPLFAFAETRFQAVQDNVTDRHNANTIRHDRALCDHLSHWIGVVAQLWAPRIHIVNPCG